MTSPINNPTTKPCAYHGCREIIVFDPDAGSYQGFRNRKWCETHRVMVRKEQLRRSKYRHINGQSESDERSNKRAFALISLPGDLPMVERWLRGSAGSCAHLHGLAASYPSRGHA